MFTVKAMIHARSIDVPMPSDYQLFQAAQVRVSPSSMNGVNGPGQPAYVPPQLEVNLCMGENDPPYRTLYVGAGLDHYQTIYVLNDRGKTIDTIIG